MLDLSFDKQEWTGFCSANVRFHLVWSKGLEGERERVVSGNKKIRCITVNTFKKSYLKKDKSFIGLISWCLVRVH